MADSQTEYTPPSRVEPSDEEIPSIYESYGIRSLDSFQDAVSEELQRQRQAEKDTPVANPAALKRAYEAAYLRCSNKIAISDAMTAALDDAALWIVDLHSEFDRDDVDASVESLLIQKVAKMMPAYCARGLSTNAFLHFDNGDRKGGAASRT